MTVATHSAAALTISRMMNAIPVLFSGPGLRATRIGGRLRPVHHMIRPTDDLRIRDVRPLIPPAILLEEIPIGERASNVVADARAAIAAIIAGADPRLVVVAGPCSIHDPRAAFEYAGRLKAIADRLADDLLIVMRT